MNEPATPSSAVMMMPPGSLPGMTSLASAPTTRPTIRVIKICMTALLGLGLGCGWLLAMEASTKPANAALDVRAHAIDDGAPHVDQLVERDLRRPRAAPSAPGARRCGCLRFHAPRSSTPRATPRRPANARSRAALPQRALARARAGG